MQNVDCFKGTNILYSLESFGPKIPSFVPQKGKQQ